MNAQRGHRDLQVVDLVDAPTLVVNYREGTVSIVDGTGRSIACHDFRDEEAFWLVANAYLRLGWDQKYVYSFSWLGRPVIQLPDDLLTMQEAIFAVRPDVVVEVGVAHGGSLIFYASLCRLLGRGRVIGVDIEIRPHNRIAIEQHPLSPLITLVEGDSLGNDTIAAVRATILPGESVLVVLDGDHAGEHVAAELERYAPLVTPGSWIVAMDGITGRLVGAPRSHPDWATSNPRTAAEAYAAKHPEFALEWPSPAFNEGSVASHLTYSPNGFLRRIS